VVLALLLAAPRAHAEDIQVSDTHVTLQDRRRLPHDPDGARYEEAYREFKDCVRRFPSWKILGNLGITSMKLERDGEAVDAFEKYLAGGARRSIRPSVRRWSGI